MIKVKNTRTCTHFLSGQVLILVLVLMLLTGCGDKSFSENEVNAAGSFSSSAVRNTFTRPAATTAKTAVTTTVLQPEKEETSAVNARPAEVIEEDHRMSDSEYEEFLESVVFVGDSIALGFGSYQKVPAGCVYAELGVGPSNIKTKTFEFGGGNYTVKDILSCTQPKNIVVSMGLNEINGYKPEKYADMYMEFIDSVMDCCPSARCYVLSVTPVVSSCERIVNSTIDSFNRALEKAVSEHSGDVRYVDCGSELKCADGGLDPELSSGDGIHLCGDAYDIMLDSIRSAE